MEMGCNLGNSRGSLDIGASLGAFARLVYLTNLPALLLTALLVPFDGSNFMFYATLVLSCAIQWAAIGLLVRAILLWLG